MLAFSIPLSSRILMNRGKRRLRPLVFETRPKAALETGLIVMLLGGQY